jgi:hypothetical protein
VITHRYNCTTEQQYQRLRLLPCLCHRRRRHHHHHHHHHHRSSGGGGVGSGSNSSSSSSSNNNNNDDDDSLLWLSTQVVPKVMSNNLFYKLKLNVMQKPSTSS